MNRNKRRGFHNIQLFYNTYFGSHATKHG
jgi:hypothetical protein